MTTRVAVSILNYNSADETLACVQSLLDAHDETDELTILSVFVTDNHSMVDDQSKLKQSLAEISCVNLRLNPENKGFAAGHNDNLRVIFHESDPDYVWVLNNDCLVYEETLSSLINCAQQRPDIGIWGATLLEPDGKTIQCAGGCFYNPWVSSYQQHGQGRALALIDQLDAAEFDYVAGASMFFPVATLQTGLHSVSLSFTDDHPGNEQWLNEQFFLYFEELDLAKRLKPGMGLAWCKNALIRHTGGTSTGAVDKQRTAVAEYHSTLSALRFTRLYYPKRLWVVVTVRYLAKMLQLVFNGNIRLIEALTRAYRDFLFG